MTLVNFLTSIDYEMVANFFDAGIACGLLVFLILGFYYIIYFIESFRKVKRLPKGEIQYRFAVFIPARNEHKVIANILESLVAQDYPRDKFDIFVIIESKDDPTFNIAKKYGAYVVVRKDLINKRTKGFAIQEGIQYLKDNNLSYDSLMIFDADNVVNKDYLSLMNDVKNQGYEVGVGYRNFTNSKVNWISACSATLFSFMNEFTSKGRSRFFKKATLTGTGYYIDFKVIEDAGGWIFTGLTEDVQVTTYCYYHNVSMHYYPYAVYYDEQPTKFKQLHKQHIRWLFGFMDDRKFLKKGIIYHQDHMIRRRIGLIEYNLSIWPFLVYVIVELLAFITMFVLTFVAFVFDHDNFTIVGLHCLFNFILLYGSFMFIATLAIIKDNKNLKFNFWQSMMVILTYGVFLGDFILSFFDGMIHKRKRTDWSRIEHEGKITNEEIKKK